MLGKKRIFFTILAVSLVLSLFSSVCFALEIEIKPVLEGKDYYIMRLGEIQTFQADGFSWDKERQEKIPGIEIKEARWDFDSRFLESTEIKDNAITLRAIRKRTAKLTVTGKIDNMYVTKSIFIVIK